MKKFLYILFFTTHISLLAQDCMLPTPYTNGSTGSDLSVFLHSSFLSSLTSVLSSENPYIVAFTSDDVVVGSASIAPDSLNNGMQSLVVWGDDIFTPEIVEGAPEGDSISLKVVDGTHLYLVNKNFTYSTNGIIQIMSGIIIFQCSGDIQGCTDDLACNYDSTATLDDGTCKLPEEYYDCEGSCLNDSDGDGICDELEIIGCFEPMACNYHATATDEGACIFPNYQDCESCSGGSDGTGTLIDYDADDDEICDSLGCTDAKAMNHNPFAIEDDESCKYLHLLELNPLEVNVYPNPIIDQITIFSPKSYAELQIKITSTIGSMVFHKTLENVQADERIEVDVQSFPSGLYMMTVSSLSDHTSIPLIKK